MTAQIKGSYLLLRVLGRGGQAEVFEGRKLGAAGVACPVAIKRIRPDHQQNEQFREAFRDMFVTEAQLTARLRHDNIVSILDFEEDVAGELFLVMELVDGIDLNALLRTGHLPPPVALFVASEAASCSRPSSSSGFPVVSCTATARRYRPLSSCPRDLSSRQVRPLTRSRIQTGSGWSRPAPLSRETGSRSWSSSNPRDRAWPSARGPRRLRLRSDPRRQPCDWRCLARLRWSRPS